MTSSIIASMMYSIYIPLTALIIVRAKTIKGSHLRYILSSIYEPLMFTGALGSALSAAYYLSISTYVFASLFTLSSAYTFKRWWEEIHRDEDSFWKKTRSKIKTMVTNARTSSVLSPQN